MGWNHQLDYEEPPFSEPLSPFTFFSGFIRHQFFLWVEWCRETRDENPQVTGESSNLGEKRRKYPSYDL